MSRPPRWPFKTQSRFSPAPVSMYKAVTRRNAEYTLMNADATYRVPDKDPTSGHPDLHTLHTKPRGRKFAFSPAVGRMGRIVCGAHSRHDAAGPRRARDLGQDARIRRILAEHPSN